MTHNNAKGPGFNPLFGGDVSGTLTANKVVGIQNTPIENDGYILTNDVLTYNAADSSWSARYLPQKLTYDGYYQYPDTGNVTLGTSTPVISTLNITSNYAVTLPSGVSAGTILRGIYTVSATFQQYYFPNLTAPTGYAINGGTGVVDTEGPVDVTYICYDGNNWIFFKN